MSLWTATAANPAGPAPAHGPAITRHRRFAAGAPIRVVVVDDDADDRMMIRRYLNGARSCRFSVRECADATSLSTILEAADVDVILIDQRLGGQVGTDVIRRIGGSRATVPAVLLTGSDAVELEEEAIESGAAEHLNKADLSSRVLERAIKYAVKWHSDQQALRHQGEQLQLAWNEAASANRAKSVFLASMSHELRTPLNAIIGFSSMLLQGSVASIPRRVCEYARHIRDGGDQLLHLVNNLLDIARLEAGQYLLGDEDLDLAALIDQAVAANGPLARQRGVTVDSTPASDLPTVRADRTALQQIFANLLSNATKYTPAGGRVTIAAERFEGGVQVAVADTGIGMTSQEIASALHPFSRNHQNAYVRATDGAGLGLSIVTSLVDQLGLSIDFKSAPDHGTTVTVTIPACRIVRSEPPHSP